MSEAPDWTPEQLNPAPTYGCPGPSAFDALLTRIAVSAGNPEDRVILESFIESQKAPAYYGSQQAEPSKPIDQYPIGDDPLTCVKQQIVVELFRAIRREDSQAIALLIQNNIVTANTTSEAGQTPLLEAISTKIIHLVQELLDFGADPNAFGVVVSSFFSAQSLSNVPPPTSRTKPPAPP